LRSGLRDRFKQSPLYDARTITRDLESLYQQAWADWCAGAPIVPESTKPALSICVALKDRSRRTAPDGRKIELFPNCIKSLTKALPRGETIELVVADYASTDWPLEQWLVDAAAGMSVKIVRCEGEFARGRARNEAARAASADALFFCDADMLIPTGLLSMGLDLARRGIAFFPVCQLTESDGRLGSICFGGFGNVFISRARFEQGERWPEFKSWGGEDDLFWDWCYRDGEARRVVIPDFLHQWHPLEFRDEFAARPRLSDFHEKVYGRHQRPAGTGPLVAISAKVDLSRLVRQTPGGKLQWDGVDFAIEPVDHCDLLIGINQIPPAAMNLKPTRGTWALLQEPPVAGTHSLHQAQAGVSRVFTQDPTRTGEPYVQSHGALPWTIGKSFDELIALQPPAKSCDVSCVCSSLASTIGHQQRLLFVEQLSAALPSMDRFGRGIQFISNKWDALAGWKYSIAIENFSGPHYWTEKLIDCYLTWTLPFYFGCTNLETYFPAESFIRIDINDVPAATETIKQAIRDDWWSKRLDAIAEARRLVLMKHQIFPFIVEQLRRD
jgi:hypothetical protein